MGILSHGLVIHDLEDSGCLLKVFPSDDDPNRLESSDTWGVQPLKWAVNHHTWD